MIDLNPWFWITLAGEPELWLGVAGGAAAIYLAMHKRAKKGNKLKPFLEVLILGLLLTLAATAAIKQAAAVERPCDSANAYCLDDYSFPSGHAAGTFAAATSLALFWRRGLLAYVLAGLIAYSRVALGVHTLADIAAGALLGVAVTAGVWKGLGEFKARK